MREHIDLTDIPEERHVYLDDVYEPDPYEGHETNWGPVVVVVVILVAILAAARCFASDRDKLALAEAEAFAQVSQRRTLPNDFDIKPNRQTAIPRIAFAAAQGSETAVKRHVVVFTADWCGPCKAMHAANGDGNDQVEFTYVDCEGQRPREIHASHWKDAIGLINAKNPIPLATWYDGHDQLRYVSGYLTTRQILERIGKSDPPPIAYAASGSATIHARQQIRDMLAWFRKYAGDKAELRLSRTGKQKFELLSAGVDYSLPAIMGNFGRIEVTTSGPLPVQNLALNYQIDGEDLVIDPDAIRFRGMIARLGKNQEVSAIDPVTLLTIAGALNSLWQLLHPSCDLEVGGNISCEATLSDGVLSIKFTDCPRLRIKALWQWLLGVQEVQISEEQVRIIFEPQKSLFPIRERVFAVED